MELLDSLKGLISPELLQKASSSLGEDSGNVSSAISSIIPGIMSQIMHNGDNNNVASALHSVSGNSDNILSGISDIFSGQADESTKNSSTNLLGSLFGNNMGAFTEGISKQSGISQDSAGKLMAMLTPIVAGFLTKQHSGSGGFDLTKLVAGLTSNKDNLSGSMPDEIGSLLGKNDGNGGGILDSLKGLFG